MESMQAVARKLLLPQVRPAGIRCFQQTKKKRSPLPFVMGSAFKFDRKSVSKLRKTCYKPNGPDGNQSNKLNCFISEARFFPPVVVLCRQSAGIASKKQEGSFEVNRINSSCARVIPT